MDYIKEVEVKCNKLICSHPKVKEILKGGIVSESNNETKHNFIYLIMLDNSKHKFISDDDKLAIVKAEDFLNKLQE